MNTWSKSVEDYIQMRRSLGFKLQYAQIGLLNFVAFLEECGAHHITIPLAMQWAQHDPGARPAEWARRLSFVRGFARFWSAHDSKTEIPPWGLLPHRAGRARPYLYSDHEVRRLLQASTQEVLSAYAARRDRLLGRRPTPYFFVTKSGTRLDGGEVRRTFYDLSRRIGLRGISASHGPRLHDFRHRFAVKTLVQWYRAGQDVERRLPILSTYLGHVHVADTYWYLTACPELMGLVVKRLERHWEGQA